uniref:Uncharacterized protein MTH_793 n=1 Tax=Lygus hesperus TaxID=30085 RepID=A0A0A9ZEN0_LYGHE
MVGSVKSQTNEPESSTFPWFNKPACRVEGACASGGLAIMSAVDALRAGRASIALATGVEIQTTASARVGGDYLARAADYDRQRSLDDFTFPCLFAKRMSNIVTQGHFTMEDTALVAAKAYANGNKNPLAHMHTRKMSFDDCNNENDRNVKFLGNETYKPFLRTSDCSQVSDGGAGVVLATEEGIAKLGMPITNGKLVELKSLECATGNLYEDPCDATRMYTSQAAAAKALCSAKVTPQDL